MRNRKHVQISAEAMFVAPDGTCYLNSGWDEDGYEAGIYRNGDVVGNCDDLHGWGRSGGKAICATDKYIYVAMSQRGDDGGNYPAKNAFGQYQYPPRDRIWQCVRRYDLTGKPAPFEGGSGHDGSMLIVADTPLPHKPPNDEPLAPEITGLACSAAVNRLYVVCDPFSGGGQGLSVYDAETMKSSSDNLHFAVPTEQVMQIAVGEKGDLWVLVDHYFDNLTDVMMEHFTTNGTPIGEAADMLNIPSAGNVISLDESHHRIFVVEQTQSGANQQVDVYDIGGKIPRLAANVGVVGGIFAGSGAEIGRVGPMRFNQPMGAGCDRAGNLYVVCSGSVDGGGTTLESYAPSTANTWLTRNWRLLGLEFVDGGDFDPASDGHDLYTKEEHFALDFSRPAGQDVTYVGYTVQTHPRDSAFGDFRLESHPATAFVRRIRNHLTLFTTDMYIGALTVNRFAADSGELGIPCGLLEKATVSTGESIWLDTNGDGQRLGSEMTIREKPSPNGWGWCVDSNGNIYQATDREGIRRFPCGGLDKYGSPIYSFETMETIPTPSPITELCRAEYIAETDTMFLSGYTTERPHTGGEWGTVGTEVVRFDHWKAGNRKPNLRIPLLYDGKKDPKLFIKSLSVAGNYVFCAEGRDPERIFVYDARTGKLQGVLQPDETVGSHSGWIDHPYGIRAFRRKNGEYLVLAEEDLDAKLILYRWMP